MSHHSHLRISFIS